MQLAYIILAVAFSVALTMSARLKLIRDQRAVEVIGDTVGVPLGLFPVLALLEIAGAAGLLVGIGLESLGVAAATCLVLYFLVAVASHLRKRDLVAAHVLPAVVMLALSAAVLLLRLAA